MAGGGIFTMEPRLKAHVKGVQAFITSLIRQMARAAKPQKALVLLLNSKGGDKLRPESRNSSPVSSTRKIPQSPVALRDFFRAFRSGYLGPVYRSFGAFSGQKRGELQRIAAAESLGGEKLRPIIKAVIPDAPELRL